MNSKNSTPSCFVSFETVLSCFCYSKWLILLDCIKGTNFGVCVFSNKLHLFSGFAWLNTGDRLVESKRSRSIPSVKELVQRMSGFQIEDIHPGKIETVPKSFGESKLQEREKGTSIYLYSKCKLEGERPKTYRSCLCVFE